jgi:hypothetical protein
LGVSVAGKHINIVGGTFPMHKCQHTREPIHTQI